MKVREVAENNPYMLIRTASTGTDRLTGQGSKSSSLNESQDVDLGDSTSKSRTNNLVSSVPFLLPTAQTNFVSLARILQTTPPDPPESRATKLRMNSPVFTSHNLTVPSSEDVITKFLLNWRHVTADWCLYCPVKKKLTQNFVTTSATKWISILWKILKDLIKFEGTVRLWYPRLWQSNLHSPKLKYYFSVPSLMSNFDDPLKYAYTLRFPLPKLLYLCLMNH